MTTLTSATPDDVPAMAALLHEMDRFYGASDQEARVERGVGIRNALFADPPAAYALLAWDGPRLIGMATYSYLWPAAGVTTSLFLKELYVPAGERGTGVGREIMDRLQRIADERGCSRVEWMADSDNPGAQSFYDKLGHQPDTSKLFYRVTL